MRGFIRIGAVGLSLACAGALGQPDGIACFGDQLLDIAGVQATSFWDLDVDGDVCCAMAGGGWLYIFTTNPDGRIQEVGRSRWATNPKALYKVTVDLPLVCIATDEEVVVLDVSDLEHPVELARVGEFGPQIYQGDFYESENLVELDGDQLVIVAAGVLSVVDLSTPSTPVVVGHITTPGVPTGARLVGDRVYVSDVNKGLEIYDVSDPALPVLVGSAATGFKGVAVAVSGDYAFVPDGVLGSMIRVFDCSSPTSPVLAASIVTPNAPGRSVSIADGLLYAGTALGMATYDVSNPLAPTLLRMFYDPHLSGHFQVEAGQAGVYVAGHHTLLLLKGDGAATSTSVVGELPPASPTVGSIHVDGTLAYIIDHVADELVIVDVSDPANPARLGAVGIGNNTSLVGLSGGYAFLRTGVEVFKAVDVSDPSMPVFLGSWNHPAGPDLKGVAVADGRMYGANWYFGFITLDVTDPLNPILLSDIVIPGSYSWHGVAVHGDLVAVGGIYSGQGFPHTVQLIDVSNPKSPIVEGRWNPSGPVNAMEFTDDGVLVMASYQSSEGVLSYTRVATIDVSNLDFPVTIDDEGIMEPGALFGNVHTSGLELSPGRAYVRTTISGFMVQHAVSGVSGFSIDGSGQVEYLASFFPETGIGAFAAGDGVLYGGGSALQIHNAAACVDCLADLAVPFGVLNFFDVSAFLAAYNGQDPAADFAEPFGVFNFFDVSEFLASYNAGCP